MNATKFEKFRDDQLKDEQLRRAYDDLEPEFELAKEVIALRQTRNLTQKQLADQMGTSQPAIARLESGNYHNVSLAFLRRLAQALGAVTEIHLKQRGA